MQLPIVFQTIAWLIWRRTSFRTRRMIHRATRLHRLPATLATIAFLGLYTLNGVTMLSLRQPSIPESTIRWLCGGMMLYLLYHAVRCVWSDVKDLETSSPATDLWIGGAPISMAFKLVLLGIDRVVASMIKAALLMVATSVDAKNAAMMFVGLAIVLTLVDLMRDCIVAALSVANHRQRMFARVGVTAIISAVVLSIVARIAESDLAMQSPLGMMLAAAESIGHVASSEVMVGLGIWIRPAAALAIASLNLETLLIKLPTSIATLAILFAIRVRLEDRRCGGGSEGVTAERNTGVAKSLFAGNHDRRWTPADLMVRRSLAAARRYRGTITMSFVLPTVLCLSPLFAGDLPDRWIFVVGGVAFCTAILAPSALKIDFRSDLRRIGLMRSLPISVAAMSFGQIAIPILLTWIFQAVVIGTATFVLQPGVGPTLMWTGLMMALAVVTFCCENSLFLAFPYHAHDNGLAMVVRAKLTFLAKATVLIISLLLLAGVAVLCRRFLGSYSAAAIVVVPVGLASLAAAASFVLLMRSWRRFDLSGDLPLG